MVEKILIANRGEVACRIIKTAKKIILPTITMSVLNISNLSAQEPQTKNLQPSSNNRSLAYNRKVMLNISDEIDKRADWFVNNFLLAAKKHLSALQNSQNKKVVEKTR